METHRFLLFLVDWDKFVKKTKIMKTKIKKSEFYSKLCFLVHFHILCENFRKIGRTIKKMQNFQRPPMEVRPKIHESSVCSLMSLGSKKL